MFGGDINPVEEVVKEAIKAFKPARPEIDARVWLKIANAKGRLPPRFHTSRTRSVSSPKQSFMAKLGKTSDMKIIQGFISVLTVSSSK